MEQDNPVAEGNPPDRSQLVAESALVADLVGSALAILDGSDAGVSLIGKFIGLAGVTGGLGVSTIRAAEAKYVVELAKFFAERFEDAAKVFRRIEAGENVEDIMQERERTEQLLSGEPDSGGVVLD
jgi:hypothetical protein